VTFIETLVHAGNGEKPEYSIFHYDEEGKSKLSTSSTNVDEIGSTYLIQCATCPEVDRFEIRCDGQPIDLSNVHW
jgi:hypothetical protein